MAKGPKTRKIAVAFKEGMTRKEVAKAFKVCMEVVDKCLRRYVRA